MPTRCAALACMLFALLACATASAQDAQPATQGDSEPAIRSRSTKIYVNGDGSLDVEETTIINAAVPRELHRDLIFPGRRIKADDVLILNAEGASAHVSQLGDGVRIDIRPNYPTGVRKFEIDYRFLYGVTGHRGNRLYWPLTAGSNPLPVRHASLRVSLPEETPSDQIHVRLQLDDTDVGGQLKGGNPVDGYRVALAWPQGVDAGQILAATITYGDAPLLASASGVPLWTLDGRIWLAILALYYLTVKLIFTGSSGTRPLVAEYEPPDGCSAAAIRLLWRNGYDPKCFTAGILGIAAKGGLTLSKQANGTWLATRTDVDAPSALTLDERALRAALFTFNSTLAFTGPDAESLELAETSFRSILEQRCASIRPMSLAGLTLPGWLIAVLGAMYLYSFGRNPAYLAAELIGATTILALALVTLAKTAPHGLLRAIKLQGALAAVVCVAAWLGGTDTIHWLWLVALLAAQTTAAWWLLHQHGKETPLLRQIHGFRWYLGTAEQQEMEARFQPALHPELQASYLPYALALDVEVAWNARFARTVEAVEQHDFIAGMNRDSSDHATAVIDLLRFAQAMSASTQTRSDTTTTDT